MNCPNCGNEIRKNQKFCTVCGAELKMESKENIQKSSDIADNADCKKSDKLKFIIVGLITAIVVMIIFLTPVIGSYIKTYMLTKRVNEIEAKYQTIIKELDTAFEGKTYSSGKEILNNVIREKFNVVKDYPETNELLLENDVRLKYEFYDNRSCKTGRKCIEIILSPETTDTTLRIIKKTIPLYKNGLNHNQRFD